MKISSELVLVALAFTAAHAINSNNLRLADSQDLDEDDLDFSLDVDTDDYDLLLSGSNGSGFKHLDNSGALQLDTNPQTKSGGIDAIAGKGDLMLTDTYSKSGTKDSALNDLITYPNGGSTVTHEYTGDSSSLQQDPELLKLLDKFSNKLDNFNTNDFEEDDGSRFDLFEQETVDKSDMAALKGLDASGDLGSLNDATMPTTASSQTFYHDDLLLTITGSQLEDMEQGSDDASIMMKDDNNPATKDSMDYTEGNHPLQMDDDPADSTSNDDYDILSTKSANLDDIFDFDGSIDDETINALLLDDGSMHSATGVSKRSPSMGSSSSQSFTELMKSLGLSTSPQNQDLDSSNDDDFWMKDGDITLTSQSKTDDDFILTDDEAIMTKEFVTKGRAPVMDDSSLDGDSPLQITPAQKDESALQLQ